MSKYKFLISMLLFLFGETVLAENDLTFGKKNIHSSSNISISDGSNFLSSRKHMSHGPKSTRLRKHRKEMHKDRRFEFMFQKVIKILELNHEQKQQVDDLMSDLRPDFESLRKKTFNNRQLIIELNPDDKNYNKELEILAATHGDLAEDLENLKGKVRGEIFLLLNSEQRNRFENHLDKITESNKPLPVL